MWKRQWNEHQDHIEKKHTFVIRGCRWLRINFEQSHESTKFYIWRSSFLVLPIFHKVVTMCPRIISVSFFFHTLQMFSNRRKYLWKFLTYLCNFVIISKFGTEKWTEKLPKPQKVNAFLIFSYGTSSQK